MVWSKDRWHANEQVLLTNGLVVTDAEIMAGGDYGGSIARVEHVCPMCDGYGWEDG
jgi:hypothetical protein